MSNEELVALIQNGRDDLKGQLCEQNRGLVYHIARKLSGMEELEDLLQDGYIGLLEAAERYEPDKGAKFSTFAIHYILMRMYRNSNYLIRLPEYLKVKINQYRQLCESYLKKYGEAPRDHVILRELDITKAELRTIRKASEAINTDSLQRVVAGDDLALQDTIPDRGDFVADVIEAEYQQELKAAIWSEVDKLPARQAETIRAKYIEGRTISEVSRSSNSHAKYDEAKAIRTLRRSKKLKHFCDDIRSSSMRGTGVRRFRETGMSSTERAALWDLGEL